MGLFRRVREGSEARRILEQHSRTLSVLTSVPAERIYREMVKLQLTPAEWAEAHGIDPGVLRPHEANRPQSGARSHLPQSQRQSSRAGGPDDRSDLDALWETVRLDPHATRPSEGQLSRIIALQEELALLLSEPAPLLAETRQVAADLVELHGMGARADATFINAVILQDSQSRPGSQERILTQEALDEWQGRAVQAAKQPPV